MLAAQHPASMSRGAIRLAGAQHGATAPLLRAPVHRRCVRVASYQPGRDSPESIVKKEVGTGVTGTSVGSGIPVAGPGVTSDNAEILVKIDTGVPGPSGQVPINNVNLPSEKPLKVETDTVVIDEDDRPSAAKDAVDSAASTAEQGIDVAQDVATAGIDAAAGVASAGAEAVQGAVGAAADMAEDMADDAERNRKDLERQFDSAAQQVEQGFDQLGNQAGSFAQRAVDSLADGIKYFQEATGEPPKAPFDGTPLFGMTASPPEDQRLPYYRFALLASVAGLDRGFAASPKQATQVEAAVTALTDAASPISLSWETPEDSKSSSLAQIAGTWRLLYSSGFQSGSLGGRQPGPAVSLLPLSLGQVYQVIDPVLGTLDNVVELYSQLRLPELPFAPTSEPVVVTATLKHQFQPLGGSTVQIIFDDVQVKASGGIGGLLGRLSELSVPQLPEPFRPSQDRRTSTFELLYLDNELRITRGSRGELRIFVKT